MTIKELLTGKSITFTEKSDENWLKTDCLWCGKNNLYINALYGYYRCFTATCNSKGSLKWLLEKLNLPVNTPVEVEEFKKEEDYTPPPIDYAIYMNFHENLLKSEKYLIYLKEKRNISIDSVKKFKLGLHGRDITIPVFNSIGDCINIKYRSNPFNDSQKSIWSLLGRGQPVLFNIKTLSKKNDRIIICEGEFDCILLEQYGYAAVTSTGGAGNFHSGWIPLFERCEKIYICFDNDLNEAGQKGALKTAKQFLERNIKTNIINLPFPLGEKPGEKVDITDFFVKYKKEKSDFTQLLLNAVLYSGDDSEVEFIFVNGDKFYDTIFPPDNYIVKNFICEESISLFGGFSGSMKSYITLSLIKSILCGDNFLEKFPTQKVPILLIDKENRESLIHKRLIKLGINRDQMKDFHYLRKGDFAIENAGSINAVSHVIKTYGIKLVVMDSLIRIHSKEENSASEMNKVYQILRKIINSSGASILLIHHFNKLYFNGTYSDPRSLLRGSGDILGYSEIFFASTLMEECPDQNIIKLEFGKTRDGSKGKPMLVEASFIGDETRFEFLKEFDENDKIALVAKEDEVMGYIKLNSPSRSDLIAAFDGKIPRGTLDRIIKRLKIDGTVTTMTNGKQEIIYTINYDKNIQ